MVSVHVTGISDLTTVATTPAPCETRRETQFKSKISQLWCHKRVYTNQIHIYPRGTPSPADQHAVLKKYNQKTPGHVNNLDLLSGIRVIVTQRFNFVNGTLSALAGSSQDRISLCYMDNRLALHMLHASLPVLPVIFTSDQKAYKHARVHLADMNAAQSRGMT